MTPNYRAFVDLIRVVEKVPPEKFDMTNIAPIDGCGCAMYHYQEAIHRHIDLWSAHFNILRADSWYLFGGDDYPMGADAAKLELFRRIREVLGIAKP